MSGDLLGSEPAPLRRRTVVAGVLALVLVALLAGADRLQQGRERAALVRAVAAAEDVVARSAAVREGLRAHQAALSNVVADPPPPSAADERALVDDAARWLPRLARAQAAVSGVRVLPWHRRLRAARAAHEVRLAHWRATLARASTDPRAALRQDPAVTASRDAAVRALRAVAGAPGAAAFG